MALGSTLRRAHSRGPADLGQTFIGHLQFAANLDQLFVVTAEPHIELPAFADDSTWSPSSAAAWSMQSHGEATSIDAITGPDGFLDSFSFLFF